MSKRIVILGCLVVAMLFGVVLSGCNDNREQARRDKRERRSDSDRGRRDRRTARVDRRDDDSSPLISMRSDRQHPAEVLSASVRRSPESDRRAEQRRPSRPMAIQPIYTHEFTEFASVSEARPAPVPAAADGSYMYYVRDSHVNAPTQYGYSEPGYLSDAYSPNMAVYDPPVPVVVLSPQLSMAQAVLEPAPLASVYIPTADTRDLVVPAIQVQQLSAPIPELEPVRYQRIATPEPSSAPKPVMMSGGTAPRPASLSRTSEVERALAPLSSPAQAGREWVPSPVTAMRGRF